MGLKGPRGRPRKLGGQKLLFYINLSLNRTKGLSGPAGPCQGRVSDLWTTSKGPRGARSLMTS